MLLVPQQEMPHKRVGSSDRTPNYLDYSGNLFPIEIPNVIHAGKVSHLYNLSSAST